MMEVIDGGDGVAPSGDAQGLVLDALQRDEGRFAGIRSPDGACVVDNWRHVGLIGSNNSLLLTTPRGSGDGSQDAQFFPCTLDDVFDVRTEAKMWIQANAEKTRILV